MWIKICGNTNLEDAHLAIDCGASALGFVFAESPRRVSGLLVKKIVASLPASIETYGVFVGEDAPTMVRIVSECGLSGIQLHGADHEMPQRLRDALSALGRNVKIIGVAHHKSQVRQELPSRADVEAAGVSSFEFLLTKYGRDTAIDYLLMDAATPERAGGTGKTFDWGAAAEVIARTSPEKPLIAAGGLRPENVGLAIATLRPWGVDVVSGVEAAPGKKDPARLRAFIAAVRNSELVNTGKSAPAAARTRQSAQSAHGSQTVAGEAKDLAGAGQIFHRQTGKDLSS
jgi:phosphoribosylanthranilate isomerase